MPLLHEVLAVEKTRLQQFNTLLADTNSKFGKPSFFQGHTKTLKMIEDSEKAAAIEAAAMEEIQVPTTVPETLGYMLDHWAIAEDLQMTKNKGNQRAAADLIFRGQILLPAVPVDQLMGLEARLTLIRDCFKGIPTLSATVRYEPVEGSGRVGLYRTALPEVTTKTEKKPVPFVKAPATAQHPAQVETVIEEAVIGRYSKVSFSGAITSLQKANLIAAADELIAEARKARQRANCIEVNPEKGGRTLANLFLNLLQTP